MVACAAEITARLTQLHDTSLRELFEAINGHNTALHGLVQQAHAELSALVGRAAPPPDSNQVRSEQDPCNPAHAHFTAPNLTLYHCYCRLCPKNMMRMQQQPKQQVGNSMALCR